MPVSYRVWISGFADDERQELGALFVRRSLLAYEEADSPRGADLLIVDADQPQTFAELGIGRTAVHVLYVGHTMPPEARWHLPRPLVPGLVLRMLDELVASERPSPHRYVDAFEPILDAGIQRAANVALAAAYGGVSRDADGPSSGFVPLDAIDDPLSASETSGDGPPAQGVDTPPSPGAAPPGPPSFRTRATLAERRSQKLRHRAAVRRARQGRIPGRAHSQLPLRALVVDGHPASRLETGVLLQAFGFRAYTVGSVAEAERALWTKSFAVAFVGDPADGPAEVAGIELCHRIKRGSYGQPDQPLPKVVMLSQHPRPADPIRARLAGCDHFVAGPATRGTLALALDAVDVPMPRDPRRSA